MIGLDIDDDSWNSSSLAVVSKDQAKGHHNAFDDPLTLDGFMLHQVAVSGATAWLHQSTDKAP